MATAIDLSNANGKNVVLANPDTNVDDVVVDASKIVSQVGDQDIGGIKKFTSSPIVPTPTVGDQAANKAYADLKVALASFTGTNVSLNANGYQKLPSGLIIQWGKGTGSHSSDFTITFPIAFPNDCFNVLAVCDYTLGSGTPAYVAVGLASISTTSFTARSSGGVSTGFLAIGY